MRTLAPIHLHNAIKQVEQARRELVSLYLNLPPEDPGYERAVAEATVPAHLRELSDSLYAAYESLLSMDD